MLSTDPKVPQRDASRAASQPLSADAKEALARITRFALADARLRARVARPKSP